MNNATATKRSYRSPKRAEAAQRTRSTVVAAASELFASAGYAATTMKQIADRAGVSVETVYAHGPKRQLLVAAFEVAFAGDEGRQPLGERPEASAILAIDDRDVLLEQGVRFIAAATARSAGLWRAFRAAADGDLEVQEVMDDLVERRRVDFLGNVTRSSELGGMADLPPERLADVMTLLLSHEGYELLVEQGGWSMEAYVDWVIRAVRTLVFGERD